MVNPSGSSQFAPASEGLHSPIMIEQAIRQHVNRVCSLEEDVGITVERGKLWRKAEVFYKAAIHNVSLVQKQLVITFVNEPGVDCGALKNEFFQSLLVEINDRLFEGLPTRWVPKRDISIQEDFELAGMAIAHSIMQGGPSFSLLSPALYPLVLSSECGVWSDYQRNAATEDILEFIDKVCGTLELSIL